MEWSEVAKEVIVGCTAIIITFITTYIAQQRKHKAEVERMQSENREYMFGVYNTELKLVKDMINEHVETIRQNRDTIKDLEGRIRLLIHENIVLKEKIQKLERNGHYDGKTVCTEIQGGSIELRKGKGD